MQTHHQPWLGLGWTSVMNHQQIFFDIEMQVPPGHQIQLYWWCQTFQAGYWVALTEDLLLWLTKGKVISELKGIQVYLSPSCDHVVHIMVVKHVHSEHAL